MEEEEEEEEDGKWNYIMRMKIDKMMSFEGRIASSQE